ncbi:hypothetical protein PHET_03681 [Paragonimus heterotremus]|uniref:Uncharacterized protein n=1 Tax=Paragonimus heterotremus TaxID=100268 RepID=A0A8J4WSR9_9TREM|nr:hypothetical protein PHET_03681 [Paragonimus heterotremus]
MKIESLNFDLRGHLNGFSAWMLTGPNEPLTNCQFGKKEDDQEDDDDDDEQEDDDGYDDDDDKDEQDDDDDDEQKEKGDYDECSHQQECTLPDGDITRQNLFLTFQQIGLVRHLIVSIFTAQSTALSAQRLYQRVYFKTITSQSIRNACNYSDQSIYEFCA